MKTLALVNGDLAIVAGNFYQLTGVEKIRQDLALALAEEFGSDRFHRSWGSIIRRYIGHVIDEQLQLLVRAEVLRVVKNYIIVQYQEVLRDTQVDVLGRFDTSDVIRRVLDVKVSTRHDAINVVLVLQTTDRQTVQIRKQLVI